MPTVKNRRSIQLSSPNREAREVIIGTRGSNLALWQANHVAGLLETVGISTRLETIITSGDRKLEQTPAEIGDKGLFTAELDDALLEDRIDIAVHSLKDLPTELSHGLCLAAIPKRGAPWDVLVPRNRGVGRLEDLPKNATIGSSSLRRVAQLLAVRTDLKVQPVRGNVETRLRKLVDDRLDALVLAEAGLVRLGLEDRIGTRLGPEIMVPAVGQGALGIVCATHRTALRKTLADSLTDPVSFSAALAERSLLRRLEGGCQVPVGAYGRVKTYGAIELLACVATIDGSTILRDKIEAPMERAAEAGTILAERLIDEGADRILKEIRAGL